jgi:hypothetical protein
MAQIKKGPGPLAASRDGTEASPRTAAMSKAIQALNFFM